MDNIIEIIEEQKGIPNDLSFDEYKNLLIEIFLRVKEMSDDSFNFALISCWYAMQYGRIAGIKEERRKKKKAARRGNA